jgi:hypothetical protein
MIPILNVKKFGNCIPHFLISTFFSFVMVWCRRFLNWDVCFPKTIRLPMQQFNDNASNVLSQ